MREKEKKKLVKRKLFGLTILLGPIIFPQFQSKLYCFNFFKLSFSVSILILFSKQVSQFQNFLNYLCSFTLYFSLNFTNKSYFLPRPTLKPKLKIRASIEKSENSGHTLKPKLKLETSIKKIETKRPTLKLEEN